MLNMSSSQFGKTLAIICAALMLSIMAIEIWQGTWTLLDDFGLVFSAYIAVGAWHIFHDFERLPQGETNVLNLYLWPRRYAEVVRQFWRDFHNRG